MGINGKAKAGITGGAVLLAGGALAVALIGPANAAPSAPTGTPPAKGAPVSQTGVVSSPVSGVPKGTLKGAGEVAFKVTGAGGTEAWLVTSKSDVIKDGKHVPATAIAQGDHVTLTGVSDTKINVASKVVDRG